MYYFINFNNKPLKQIYIVNRKKKERKNIHYWYDQMCLVIFQCEWRIKRSAVGKHIRCCSFGTLRSGSWMGDCDSNERGKHFSSSFCPCWWVWRELEQVLPGKERLTLCWCSTAQRQRRSSYISEDRKRKNKQRPIRKVKWVSWLGLGIEIDSDSRIGYLSN